MRFEITKCKIFLGKGLPPYNTQKSGPGNVRAHRLGVQNHAKLKKKKR